MQTNLSNFKDVYHIEKGPEMARMQPNNPDAAWLWQLPCRKAMQGAHIYTHSETHLGFMSSTTREMLRHKRLLLAKLGKDGTLHQDGDREFSIIFPVARLDDVARLVGGLRKRKISGAEKKRLLRLSEAGRRAKKRR